MKFKMTALILVLAAFSWAQTATPVKPNPTQSSTAAVPTAAKTDCPCCQKMTDGKTNESCCAHDQEASAKSETSCCKGDGKNAMACAKGEKDKSADGCCSSGKCGSDGKEGCCSKSDKTTEQAALACCGATGERCGAAHHDHADINK
jgi:hypothetical protein